MINRDVYLKALDRYIKATNHDSNKAIDTFDVIVFLEKEIGSYREKIKKQEERMNAMYGAQTLVESTTEQAADGGVMTLTRKTANWKLVAECLLTNGYFVCCHIDDENDGETITIEYWRA